MPAVEISRSMLVNQGLSAQPDLARIAENGDVVAIAPNDVVDSFKRLVVNDALTVTDRDLVATVVAFTSPLDLATFFINAKYSELGGAAGMLGTTTGAVTATPNGVGFVRTFQHGAIYFHPQVGAHALHGPVRARWQELGGEKSFLGFPTSDVTPGADVRSEGVYAHFQGGSIYWAPPARHIGSLSDAIAAAPLAASVTTTTPSRPLGSAVARLAATGAAVTTPTSATAPIRDSSSTVGSIVSGVRVDATVAGLDIAVSNESLGSSEGAFEVHGAIRQKYLSLGAEASILGYPRTDETPTPDGVGRFNHFQSGSIYWTPATSAHEVHGLIRDRWASLGWERNPQLGYPISDELIPDPRIGHRRPEVRKKPIVSLPSDMIKLPADAALAGFPSTVVNTPRIAPSPIAATPVARSTVDRPIASRQDGALGRLSDRPSESTLTPIADVVSRPPSSITLNPDLIAVATTALPASTPADARSVNRFADFESGVLFWTRGATTASTLSPLAATSDGTALSFTGADVATAAIAKIGRATFEGSNAHVASVSFVGTTGYSFDGVQTHNRRHRLQVILQGIEQLSVGPFGASVPSPVTATVELRVEVWFDAAQRRIALTPTDWSLTQASSGSYAAAVNATLRAGLDPVLWSSYELVTLPDTDNGAPIAVLSVKTLANGTVAVFVEPRNNLVLGNLTELANAVAPSVVLISEPR